MPDTIRELILKNIKSTLEGITVDNGYENTIQNVYRLNDVNPENMKDVPFIVMGAGPEDKKRAVHPLTDCDLTVVIDIWTRRTPTDTKTIDEYFSSLVGDVEKALMVDITRGGYADNTLWQGSVPYGAVEGQGSSVIAITIGINYSHNRFDPYSQT